MRLNILIFILILIYFLYKIRYQENLKIIDLKRKGFFRCDSYPIGKINTSVTKDRGMEKNKKDWYLYFPCGYTDAEDEIKKIDVKDKDQKIFMIDGCDYIVSKFTLWNILNKSYGRKIASTILPNSFISSKKNDLKDFWEFYDSQLKKNKHAKFILKNDKQRQEGIKLVRDKKEIKNLIKDEYVMQEYLLNPFTIIGHKINLRYYLLITCNGNRKSAYIHTGGFVYYTKNKYNENSLEFHDNITSGYVDRKIYEKNPLTLNDFHSYLIDNGYNYKLYFKNLVKTLVLILEATENYICKFKNTLNNTKFQLFGCDVAPDKDLNVRIMELNKGPDFTPKDKRDKAVKLKVQHDIIDLIDDVNNIDLEEKNNFMKIWDKS